MYYCLVKVKLSLCLLCTTHIHCLIKHHAMMMYWERGGTRWRWVVSFTTWPLYPQGKNPNIHWIGGWIGSRARLDTVPKRKNSCPCQESNPSHPTRSRVTILKDVPQFLTMDCRNLEVWGQYGLWMVSFISNYVKIRHWFRSSNGRTHTYTQTASALINLPFFWKKVK
jgi:hypothetical protein